jgi:type VI protein secretion system component VasK
VLNIYNKFKKFNSIPTHVSTWALAAQALPVIALVVLGIFYVFDLADAIHIAWLLVATVAAMVAVTWWWWVIYAIKDVHSLMKNTNDTFNSIEKELKIVQKDMKELRSLTLNDPRNKKTKPKTSK